MIRSVPRRRLPRQLPRLRPGSGPELRGRDEAFDGEVEGVEGWGEEAAVAMMIGV